MKLFVAVCGVIGASTILLAGTQAAEARSWVCKATSSTGSWGWGAHRKRSAAKRRALLECAVRTPRSRVCYVRWCRRR